MKQIIAFQGTPGAYSDLACRNAYPGWSTLPCYSFSDAIAAVHAGQADLAMLATENTLAGRVPDVHSLLPESGLHVIGEHFQRVEHCLLAPKGSKIEQIKRVHSHPVALGQIRKLVAELGVQPVVQSDTAGSAEMIAKMNSPEDAAIASSLAGDLFGLEVLRANVEDAAHNTTRFYVMSPQPLHLPATTPGLMTTFIFRVRNVPAALYKALGGFATNGVNMTKLESYMLAGAFTATQFLCDVEGHPEHPNLRRAFEELSFFSRETRIMGVYPMAAVRGTGSAD